MSMTPLKRSFLIPQSRPRLVCSDVSHLRSGFSTCDADSPVVTVEPNGYLAPASVFSSSCVAYGWTAWFPCRPQPARTASVEKRLSRRNSSLLSRHEAEMAGKVDHL